MLNEWTEILLFWQPQYQQDDWRLDESEHCGRWVVAVASFWQQLKMLIPATRTTTRTKWNAIGDPSWNSQSRAKRGQLARKKGDETDEEWMNEWSRNQRAARTCNYVLCKRHNFWSWKPTMFQLVKNEIKLTAYVKEGNTVLQWKQVAYTAATTKTTEPDVLLRVQLQETNSELAIQKLPTEVCT